MRIWIFLGLLAAASLAAAEPKLTRGPFLQMPESNVVAIVWRTDEPADSQVDFGFDAACINGMVADAAEVTEHVVVLHDLLPSTNYFYRVRTKTTTLSDGNMLRTPRANGQPFRFAVIGDWGDGSNGMTNIANRINAITNLDFYLTVGDNIYQNGEASLYDPYWFRLYSPTMRRVPVFPALGNHDVRPLSHNGQPFLDFFHLPGNGPTGLVGRNYSFDYGNAHFVAIDSNPFDDNNAKSQSITKTITDWVRRDLAATRQPWKFAYFHHPGYCSVGHHTENGVIKSLLLPILGAGGVQMVFTGHNHFYERLQPIHGIVHIVTGGGGASLHSIKSRQSHSAVALDNIHSFTVVDIDSNRLKLTQTDEQGRVVDTFGLTRP